MYALLYGNCRREEAEGAHHCENWRLRCPPEEVGTIDPLRPTTRGAGPLKMTEYDPIRLLTEQCTCGDVTGTAEQKGMTLKGGKKLNMKTLAYGIHRGSWSQVAPISPEFTVFIAYLQLTGDTLRMTHVGWNRNPVTPAAIWECNLFQFWDSEEFPHPFIADKLCHSALKFLLYRFWVTRLSYPLLIAI